MSSSRCENSPRLGRTASDWEQLLLSNDVACVQADKQPYADFFLTDPVVRENEFIVRVDHPTMGEVSRSGPGVKLSLTPGRAESSHLFGADTRVILSELGLSPAETDDLKSRGIVNWEEEPSPVESTK